MKPAKARALVDYLQGVFGVSIRRACNVLLFQKSSYFDKPRRPSQAVLNQQIRGIAETGVRYGYRCICESRSQIGP